MKRPWASEKEFIDADLAYLGRTAILLPNAPAREPGELIRFEIVLSTGAPVFRGEGHVVAHHAPGGAKPPGLEVRFTRIDARSKLLLDRVRERRTALVRSGSIPPPALVSHAPPPGSLSLGPPPLILSQLPGPRPDAGSLRITTARSAETEAAIRRAKERGPVAPPSNREEMLARLRERAKRLTASSGWSLKKG
ncbi:MAG TPA: hypothetical protein VK550_18615 [Polyangiaceae bacterium]|nr:hypothetical protein [Polyangiaceae bacterium]